MHTYMRTVQHRKQHGAHTPARTRTHQNLELLLLLIVFNQMYRLKKIQFFIAFVYTRLCIFGNMDYRIRNGSCARTSTRYETLPTIARYFSR